MTNYSKKIRDNQDKEVLFNTFNKKPKHRCPKCHRFSLFIYNNKANKTECVMCELIKRTKEEEENEG